MFNLVSSLAKATVGVIVKTPVALVADAITMGGVTNDRKESHTATAVKGVLKNIDKAVK